MFVVLDGIDGCGKTTQATRLVRALEAETGKETLHLREPGSTRLGEALRAILLAPGREISPAAEALLLRGGAAADARRDRRSGARPRRTTSSSSASTRPRSPTRASRGGSARISCSTSSSVSPARRGRIS
jgi:dTMP kinase